MVGGYILLNGEILAQIHSDDFDNPTEISKADFEKVYNAVKTGKELRVDIMGTMTPVITMKYDDSFCSLTFAYDNDGITLLTFILAVTVDDTDPDNPVYTYSGVVKSTAVGGGGGELYAHRITFSYSSKQYSGTLITDDATEFTSSTLLDYINNHGYSGSFGKMTLMTTDLLTDLDIINSTADNLTFATSFICKPVSGVNKFYASMRKLAFTVADNTITITRTLTEAEVTFQGDSVMSLNASIRT